MPAQFGDRTARIVQRHDQGGFSTQRQRGFHVRWQLRHDPSVRVIGWHQSNLDYFISASYLHNNVGIDNTTSSGNPLHDETDQEKLFGYFSHPIGDADRLTLLLSGSYADFQLRDTAGREPIYELTNSPPADSSTINDNQNEQNYYAVLSYQVSAGNLAAQVSALTRYTDIQFPDVAQDLMFGGNGPLIKNSDLANGLQVDGSYILGDRHTIRAGMLATYDIERLDTDSAVFPSDSQFTASPTTPTLPLPGGPVPLPGNPPQSSTTPVTITANGGNSGLTYGIYLQDEWLLTEGLTLNYGVRYDRFDVTFDHETSSARASIWSGRLTLPRSLTSAMRGISCRQRCNTFHSQPSGQFEYSTDAPFSEGDDPPKVERDHYFDAGLSRAITPPGKSPWTLLQARQKSSRRWTVRQRHHSQ